ncbi:two-component system sensor histidine kinase DesK [Catenuloplanes nepalensis]|uniref:Two-component system sensor histidine kinase DesK n=1 Tax=Catenuloplanes nepalensis TaxID=587533 RepID=A0ABT9MRB5_9ACTN|nr:histidine kinase [Catenuloplanes nepalensis]MDP9793967.1 two-component system sensor histidine kinase DesK [Catenuloplanes nepalensis]
MFRWSRSTASGEIAAVVGVWLLVLLMLFNGIGQAFAQRRRGDLTVPAELLCDALSFVIAGCYLRLEILIGRGLRDRRITVLVWIQVVASLVILGLGSVWVMLSLALGATLLVATSRRGRLAVALLGTADVILLLAKSDGTPAVLMVGVVAMVIVCGFGLYVLTRLRVVLHELRRTREEMARARVDEERLRISRELHDLLGRTLVAVSLRNEAALRLLDTDLERCRTQLTALQSLVIDGQARLRALTSGPALISLGDELAGARELFELLGVRAEIDAVAVDDHVVDQTLAAVVREAVTNTLKHGRPTWCRIGVRHEAGAVVVTVVNNGVVPPAADGAHTGLDDIRARVAAVGGVLTAEATPDGQFRVVARIPQATAHLSVARETDPQVAPEAHLSVPREVEPPVSREVGPDGAEGAGAAARSAPPAGRAAVGS